MDGPEAKITASDVRDLTADRLKRLDGFNHLLGVVDDRLRQLAGLDAPPTVVFVALPSALTKRYWSVRQWQKGVETVWNLRAGIKARAMQRGLRTQLLLQETIESDLEAHTSDLEHPADFAWNLFAGMYFKAGGFPWAPVGIPEGTCADRQFRRGYALFGNWLPLVAAPEREWLTPSHAHSCQRPRCRDLPRGAL